MLGYGAAREAPTRAYFGQGNRQVLLNDIDCSGMELNIEECQHSGWRQNICHHREDASAVCYQKGEVPLPLRLVDGNLPSDGRIEVLIGGRWGTICDDDWDLQDAQVVCSSLGYSGAAKALTKGSVTPGNASLPIYFDNVACDGDEDGLEFCRHHGVGNHNCDHSKDAGVECISGNPGDEGRSRQAREVEKVEIKKEDVEWMMELVDLNIDWN
ncbi:neurotrypsin-like [Amphiura filiformis]|uniref:neurotrypsin-like n=1 Tax=Amphiura filiformis TaxID=82378 RepID=UPI003B20FEB5